MTLLEELEIENGNRFNYSRIQQQRRRKPSLYTASNHSFACALRIFKYGTRNLLKYTHGEFQKRVTVLPNSTDIYCNGGLGDLSSNVVI